MNDKIIAMILAFSFLFFLAGSVTFANGITDDQEIIREHMEKLGFTVGKIEKIDKRTFKVKVKGFHRKTGAIVLKSKFRLFLLKVSLHGDYFLMERTTLEKMGFIINNLNILEVHPGRSQQTYQTISNTIKKKYNTSKNAINNLK